MLPRPQAGVKAGEDEEGMEVDEYEVVDDVVDAQDEEAAAAEAPAEAVPPAAGGGCVSAPGMWRDNGVSDADCAKCAEGYQWWPCNFPGYCEGSACNGGAGLAQVSAKDHSSAKRRGAHLRRQGHQGPALIQGGVAVVSTEQVGDEEL